MHDIALLYSHCQKTWGIFARLNPSNYTDEEIEQYRVSDYETCSSQYDSEELTW